MLKFLLPIPLLAFAAGCSPMHWAKPGSDQVIAEKDLGECRQIARGTAFRTYSAPPPEPFAGAAGPSPYTGMRAGSSNMWQYSSGGMGPYALEERIRSTCMRERGYDRVPGMPQQGA